MSNLENGWLDDLIEQSTNDGFKDDDSENLIPVIPEPKIVAPELLKSPKT